MVIALSKRQLKKTPTALTGALFFPVRARRPTPFPAVRGAPGYDGEDAAQRLLARGAGHTRQLSRHIVQAPLHSLQPAYRLPQPQHPAPPVWRLARHVAHESKEDVGVANDGETERGLAGAHGMENVGSSLTKHRRNNQMPVL